MKEIIRVLHQVSLLLVLFRSYAEPLLVPWNTLVHRNFFQNTFFIIGVHIRKSSGCLEMDALFVRK